MREVLEKFDFDNTISKLDEAGLLFRSSSASGASIFIPILSALSERDEAANVCMDKDGNPEPDPELRDTESVPLAESVEAFFEREVKPHVPDAWIDTSKRDPKDGKVGIAGYEINFNRYFYRYTPLWPLEEIEADIRGVEQDIVRMLAEVTGGAAIQALMCESAGMSVQVPTVPHLNETSGLAHKSRRFVSSAACRPPRTGPSP